MQDPPQQTFAFLEKKRNEGFSKGVAQHKSSDQHKIVFVFDEVRCESNNIKS